MTTAASLAQSVAPGVSLGFKNRIINGAMMIDQRNAGASATLTAPQKTYCLDRWLGYTTGANVSVQQVSSGITNIPYVAQITGAASNTAVQLSQRIESKNIADCAGLTVTLSALISNSLVSTVYWTATIPTVVDTFSSVTTAASGSFTVTSTLTQYSASFTLPSTAVNGVEINFYCLNQTSGTFKLGQVQLEVGTAATSFEFRDYGRELIMCQRYYQILRGQNFLANGSRYNTEMYFAIFFKTTMRTAATVSYNSGTNYFRNYCAGSSENLTTLAGTQGISNATDLAGVYSAITVGSSGQAGWIQLVADAAYVSFSAEL